MADATLEEFRIDPLTTLQEQLDAAVKVEVESERITDYDEPNVQATVVPLRRASASEKQWLELSDKDKYYDGWHVQVVMNPAVSVVADVSSMNLDRMILGVAALAKDWDYVDEDGEPIPCTLDGVKSLRADLVTATIRAWDRALGLPKK